MLGNISRLCICFLLLVLRSPSAAARSLKGWSFNCAGALVIFESDTEFSYPYFPATRGTYTLGADWAYTAEVSGSTYTSTNPDVHLNTLYSFSIMTNGASAGECIAVAVNYTKYSNLLYAVGCPTMNAISGTSYEENGLSFGRAGDVSFRSKLETLSGNGNTIVRDGFGVYLLDTDGRLVMLFGKQQGRPSYVVTGSFIEGALHMDNYDPTGPCTLSTQAVSGLTFKQLARDNRFKAQQYGSARAPPAPSVTAALSALLGIFLAFFN